VRSKESTGKAGGFAVGDSPTVCAPIGGSLIIKA
jgi:hypothetical protein